MATKTNNFTRSNVNAATLQITDPARSSFNLGHKNNLSIQFGKIVPVNQTLLIPSDTFQGQLKPNFHLEKIATPSLGPIRLDTHTFVVNFRRINKDLRQNLENGTNFFPTFDIYNYLLYYTRILDSKGRNIHQLYEAVSDSDHLYITAQTMMDTFMESMPQIYSQLSDEYYQKDTYKYLMDYYTKFKKVVDGFTRDIEFFTIFLPGLYKPLFGESTLFDMLGYPIYTRYNNKFTSSLESELRKNNQNDIPRSGTSGQLYYFIQQLSDVQFWLQLLTNQITYTYSNAPTPVLKIGNSIPRNYSELPLRAYYACWYDYLRNWHIEQRKNILDPDLFDNKLVFNPYTDFTIPNIPKFLSFCFIKSRDYGTDLLTSIQTDDPFRHVYSPVFNSPTNDVQFDTSSKSPQPSTVQALQILGDSLGEGTLIDIPSDDFSTSRTSASTLFQDLQTMRRAGMLERWLARNYYYPDTYVGRLQARFGVRPSDYDVLVSQYIGGSESFITGTELVANMSTTESIVGSRNLKADVSAQDSFSGTVSDYSILMSFVSTVPIVNYDVLSPAASLINYVDMPQPEFATDTRVEARVSDFLRNFSISPFIGYVPRYYLFRVAADETHGRYLTDYRSYNWLRDSVSMISEFYQFSLNPYSLRVNMPLDGFIGLTKFDDFAYGDCDVQLIVNRALPAAMEVI